MKLFANTFSTLERALNYSSLKNQVVSQNIANVDTPKYRAKDVSFQSAFQSAIETSLKANRSDDRHYEFSNKKPSQGAVINRNNVQYNHNGNSVDLDKEMADLATNQIYYHALTDRMNGKFASLQNVIKGGK